MYPYTLLNKYSPGRQRVLYQHTEGLSLFGGIFIQILLIFIRYGNRRYLIHSLLVVSHIR